MPVLSRFYGIIIYMNFRDHEPPHFHARYGDMEVLVEIETGKVKGEMSKRALNLIFEWMELHKQELMRDRGKAKAKKRKAWIELILLPEEVTNRCCM
jgi:hypothetical protein